MRKAAGFLFVLLFATLVVITTSSGDETDDSHVVHLTATYGPQIGSSCDVCHGTETPPLFSDGQNLTSTTVCDTCHSPLGAYDGVDDTTIGAKNNWSYAPPPVHSFLAAVTSRPARINGALAVTMVFLP